jgi:hypothetical protein
MGTMKTSKYSIFAVAAIGFGIFLTTGCMAGRAIEASSDAGKVITYAVEPGPTYTMSRGDHLHNINLTIERDMRGLFYDLDLLFQLDRPSRLSKWHDR